MRSDEPIGDSHQAAATPWNIFWRKKRYEVGRLSDGRHVYRATKSASVGTRIRACRLVCTLGAFPATVAEHTLEHAALGLHRLCLRLDGWRLGSPIAQGPGRVLGANEPMWRAGRSGSTINLER